MKNIIIGRLKGKARIYVKGKMISILIWMQIQFEFDYDLTQS